jgi:Cof subfamily protein (haloacid dehalogenase superfamily)
MKVLAADIDNTLRVLGEDLRGKERQALQALHERGVLLGVASGRPLWQNIENCAELWHLGFDFDFLIGLNGSVLRDVHTGQEQMFSLLCAEEIRFVITRMKEHNPDYHIFIYGDRCEIVDRADELTVSRAAANHTPIRVVSSLADFWKEPTAKILCRLENEKECAEAEQFANTFVNEKVTCFRTTPTMLEFQSPAINKGIALRKYCEDNAIAREDVWAFGDAENDIQMLETAGHGICMANGLDDVKAAADAITDYPVSEDGFGRYVFDHLLDD